MSAELLIKNAKIVTPTDTYEGCVYVDEGRIAAITHKAEMGRREKSTPRAAISCPAWWMNTST